MCHFSANLFSYYFLCKRGKRFLNGRRLNLSEKLWEQVKVSTSRYGIIYLSFSHFIKFLQRFWSRKRTQNWTLHIYSTAFFICHFLRKTSTPEITFWCLLIDLSKFFRLFATPPLLAFCSVSNELTDCYVWSFYSTWMWLLWKQNINVLVIAWTRVT